MDGTPYAAVVRLYAQAAQDWIWLEAEHPGIDLIRLPPRRLMNLIYTHTFRLWVNQDNTRKEQPVDFLRDQFDAMLALPVAGQISNPAKAKTDYLDDYRALMED